MNISFITNNFLPCVNENVLPFFNNSVKKILIIASIAFGFLTACYVASRCFFSESINKNTIKNPIENEENVVEFIDQKESLSKEEINHIARRMIDNLFENLTNTKSSPATLQKFSFTIYQPENAKSIKDVTAPLFVRYNQGEKDEIISLTSLIKAIPWHNLDKKWEKLTKIQWLAFLDRSICSSNYHGFKAEASHKFITTYTSNSGCSSMNRLLRYGKISLYDSCVNKAKKLSQAALIDKIAQERLFGCLCAAGNLQTLPSLGIETIVKRKIETDGLPEGFLSKYQKGKIVTEEAFFSTSFPKSDYSCGAINYVIKLGPTSKGKAIKSYSLYPGENECLLPPFTSFKVTEDVQVDSNNHHIIHLEEVEVIV